MLSEWKTILTNDLHALKQLSGRDKKSWMQCAVKEQEIGRHCYQAEESLTDKELMLLKKTLGLTDQQWTSYKTKIRPALE